MTESFELTLAPERAHVRRARRFVVEIAHSVRQDDLADVVELLTSEVVTNVVLHAGGDSMRITVQWSPPTFRVEVCDHNASAPRPTDYAAEATTGRGLALVDELSSAWGTAPLPDGKSVWFEVTAVA